VTCPSVFIVVQASRLLRGNDGLFDSLSLAHNGLFDALALAHNRLDARTTSRLFQPKI
jgi:hypothetical protein